MAQTKKNIVTVGTGQISQASISSRIIASNLNCTTYNPLVTYAQYNVVEYSGNLYRSLSAGNLGNQPDISPTTWTVELLAVHDGDIHIVNNGASSDIQQRIGGSWSSVGGQPIKVTLVDGQILSAAAFTYSAGSLPYGEINYTIRRGAGHGNKRQGKIIILNDGGSLQYSHEFTEIGADVEVPLTFSVGGGHVTVSYTSVLQGSAIELAYTVKGVGIMAYDSVIDKPQGSIKLSEVFTDRAQGVIDTAIGESAVIIVEQLRNIATDALRKNSYILHSTGQITWDSANTIQFDADGQANDIVLTLLQTEDVSINRTINLTLTGTLGANTTNTFNNIVLGDKELIYIELDRSTILNNVSGNIQLENAVGGLSLVKGYTVKKISIATNTSGMPSLVSPIVITSSNNTDTFNIPLAMRWDYTVGMNTYSDIWWIPHGIRWPASTTSVIGAAIVLGFEAYPNVFVNTMLGLYTALTTGYPNGGAICITANITVDQNLTIPSGVTLLGRSYLNNGSSPTVLTLEPNVTINMQSNSKIKDIAFAGNANFGQTGNHTVITMSNNYSFVEGCSFSFSNTGPTNTATAILCAGTYNKIEKCIFTGVTAPSYRIGINYYGEYNADTDCQFT